MIDRMMLYDDPIALEKKLKELKEFSRLLLLLSVAFITVSSSLHDFTKGLLSLHLLVIIAQLFAIYAGVKSQGQHFLIFNEITNPQRFATVKDKEDYLSRIQQDGKLFIKWCARQDDVFQLSFVILLLALIPWDKLASFVKLSLSSI